MSNVIPFDRSTQQNVLGRMLTRKDRKGNDIVAVVSANAVTALTWDPAWRGALALDEFADTVVLKSPPTYRPDDQSEGRDGGRYPRDILDSDLVAIRHYLLWQYKLGFKASDVADAVSVVSQANRFHPVREYLEGLRWDGARRVERWLIDSLGAEDSPYTKAVSAAWMVSCVARVMRPGEKVDTMIILEGEQGDGKSSALRALVGDEWHLEMSITNVTSKDSQQILRRKWVAEFPEFDGLSRSEAAHVKDYVSRRVDTYRPSYGRFSRDYPRQIVFAGSTNKYDYLPDETGARRFFPVRCRPTKPASELSQELATARDQLWAEAFAMYEGGASWFAWTKELAAEIKSQQSMRFSDDEPWTTTILAYCAGKERVQVSEIFDKAIETRTSDRTRADANRIASVLRRAGWEMRKSHGVKFFYNPSPPVSQMSLIVAGTATKHDEYPE